MKPNEVDTNREVKQAHLEAALVRALQAGKLEALGRLFKRHQHLVYRTALGITRDERAAEDILQECFVRLYTYAASVDPDRPLKPWLYRVTVNLAYDWATKRAAQPFSDVLDWLSGLTCAFPTPDRSAEEQETLAMVREIVAELPTLHRAVIVLFYQEDLAIEEIAQVLDLPIGTVKSRLHYARARLRESLEKRQRLVPEMTYEFT